MIEVLRSATIVSNQSGTCRGTPVTQVEVKLACDAAARRFGQPSDPMPDVATATLTATDRTLVVVFGSGCTEATRRGTRPPQTRTEPRTSSAMDRRTPGDRQWSHRPEACLDGRAERRRRSPGAATSLRRTRRREDARRTRTVRRRPDRLALHRRRFLDRRLHRLSPPRRCRFGRRG